MKTLIVIAITAFALVCPNIASARYKYCGNVSRKFEQVVVKRVTCTYAKRFIRSHHFKTRANGTGSYQKPVNWTCSLYYYGDQGAFEWVCVNHRKEISFLDVSHVTSGNGNPDPGN